MNPRHFFKPRVEVLEDLILPADYFWRPPVQQGAFLTVASNWRNAQGMEYPMNQPPDQTSRLIFTGASGGNCTVDVARTVAAIVITPEFRFHIILSANLTCTGEASRIEMSAPTAAIEKDPGLAPADEPKLIFNGSPVELISARLINNIVVENRSGNTMTIHTGVSNWRNSELNNSGIINWTGSNSEAWPAP